MELFLFRHAEFERLYLNECARISVDSIPLEQRIRPINGTILILLFLISEILYIPFIFVIWKHVSDNSCYKFLFYIGITDMLILCVCGFFSGYFPLKGAVFCTNPRLNYVLGTLGMGLWFAESIADLLLAIDRCLEMTYPKVAHRIFGGSFAWLWLALISIYSIFWLFFTKPVFFSSIFCAWFFNPLIGYVEDKQKLYVNYLHSAHDTFMAIAFPIIYALLGIRVAYMSSQRGPLTANVQRNSAQKSMFMQVAIISAFNCYVCLLYVIMQYIEVNQVHILLAHYGWWVVGGRTFADDPL